MMEEVRIQRDKDLSHKKLTEIKLLQTGKLNTFGFVGSQLMGMSGSGGDTMYNTAQNAHGPGIPGSQAHHGGTHTSYDTYGGGAYNTSNSQASMFQQKTKTRDILDRAKDYVVRKARQDAKKEREVKRTAAKDGNASSRRLDEAQKLEMEAIKAYHERQAKLQRIGSFKFDIDNDLDVEILTSDQVFEDLDDIKNMREKTGDPDANNSAYKSLIMAMYTRGKKKKKR